MKAAETPHNAAMLTLDNILTDRGSKYAVSGAPCASEEEAKILLKTLKKQKKYKKNINQKKYMILMI